MPDKTSTTADLAVSNDDAEFARKAGDRIVEGERVAGEPPEELTTNDPVAVPTADADVGLAGKAAAVDDIPGKRETDF
jgi:hypothetical protein